MTARLNISDRFFQNAGARIPIARSAILAPSVFQISSVSGIRQQMKAQLLRQSAIKRIDRIPSVKNEFDKGRRQDPVLHLCDIICTKNSPRKGRRRRRICLVFFWPAATPRWDGEENGDGYVKVRNSLYCCQQKITYKAHISNRNSIPVVVIFKKKKRERKNDEGHSELRPVAINRLLSWAKP